MYITYITLDKVRALGAYVKKQKEATNTYKNFYNFFWQCFVFENWLSRIQINRKFSIFQKLNSAI